MIIDNDLTYFLKNSDVNEYLYIFVGSSAIHLAAFYGHIEVIELLVESGANVNEANSSGYMPLHVACQNNKVEAVSKLLQQGANPCLRNQVSSWVPLHEAAWNGCIECNGLILYLI